MPADLSSFWGGHQMWMSQHVMNYCPPFVKSLGAWGFCEWLAVWVLWYGDGWFLVALWANWWTQC